jgi:glucosamine-6-phosphate deaminase
MTPESSLNNGLVVHVADTRVAMGNHAAKDIGREIRNCLQRKPGVRIVFAAAPSQNEMLAALCKENDIDWSRVTAFHMDEYIGLTTLTPRRFGAWLRHAIFDQLSFGEVHLIDPGDDPARAAADYARKLKEAPIDIVCCGIGANGHLAFNDPPADFDDPLTVKVVDLDAACRQQQVDDNCFATLSEVPRRALTMTVPALLAGRAVFCTVPGAHKRHIVRRALQGPLDPMCPASALQGHQHCAVYLDRDSARELIARDAERTA